MLEIEANLGSTKTSTEPIRPQQGLKAKSNQRKVSGASIVFKLRT